MNIVKTTAGIFILVTLTGCGTFNLGYVKPQTGKTPDQQMLDTLTCKDQARLATETAGKQVGDFLLGMTIIGAPMAYELDKKNKREFFKECMNTKGYEVIPADDDTTTQTTSSPSISPSPIKILLPEGWSDEVVTPRMKNENVRFFALNKSKDVGVALSVFKRSEIGDTRQRFASRRMAQMNALDAVSATDMIAITLNGFQGLQTEVTGNLKTGIKQRITYLQSAVEGTEEVVFITFWGLTNNHERNKPEFLRILGTLTGIGNPVSGSTPLRTTSPTGSQSMNTPLPSNTTEGARKLVELKSLLDAGVINAQDYEIKKQQILKSM